VNARCALIIVNCTFLIVLLGAILSRLRLHQDQVLRYYIPKEKFGI